MFYISNSFFSLLINTISLALSVETKCHLKIIPNIIFVSSIHVYLDIFLNTCFHDLYKIIKTNTIFNAMQFYLYFHL